MTIPSSFPPITGALSGKEIIGVVINATPGTGGGQVACVTTAQIAALGGGTGGPGTVTSVGFTAGPFIAISGVNPITGNGSVTIGLNPGAQTALGLAGTALQPITNLPASVTNANLTFNSLGQIIGASSGTSGSGNVGTVTSVTIASSTLSVNGTVTSTGALTVNLPQVNSAQVSVTAANITVDIYGRVIAATNGSGGGSGGSAPQFSQLQTVTSGSEIDNFALNATTTLLQITPTADINFTGMSQTGRLPQLGCIIRNMATLASGFTITFPPLSANSTAPGQFASQGPSGAGVVLLPQSAAICYNDSDNWMFLS